MACLGCAGYCSDSGDPRGSNFLCSCSASVKVSTKALTSATIVATMPLGFALDLGLDLVLDLALGLDLRAGFFLAVTLVFLFAGPLRFFFVFAADFLRAFLAIVSSQGMYVC